MSWVKLDPAWLEKDETEALGADAVVFHLSGLSYSCRGMTDGHVPTGAIRKLWPVLDPAEVLRTLIDAGLWEVADGGFQIVDWEGPIFSRQRMERDRENSRVTSERLRRHRANDHSMCDRCEWVKQHGPQVTTSRTASQPTSPAESPDPSLTSLDSTRSSRLVRNPSGERASGEEGPRSGSGTRSAGATRSQSPPRRFGPAAFGATPTVESIEEDETA